MSSAKVAMVSALSRNCRRSESSFLASSAATSSFSLRSRCFLDALGGVGHLDVGGLDDLPDAAQPPLDLLKFLLDGLQPLSLLASHPVHLPVHLLVQQLDQVSDVGFGEDVGPNLIDDELLEGLGVEPGGLAGPAAPLEEGVAGIVTGISHIGSLQAQGAAQTRW